MWNSVNQYWSLDLWPAVFSHCGFTVWASLSVGPMPHVVEFCLLVDLLLCSSEPHHKLGSLFFSSG